MKRSRGRSSKKKKKVFHRDWLENFSSSRLVSFELFTIRSNWPRAMPINVIYQRCNLLRGAFSIVWVNSFHRRSRGRLQKKRITTEVNKKRREREKPVGNFPLCCPEGALLLFRWTMEASLFRIIFITSP